jgi:hypothetical protein
LVKLVTTWAKKMRNVNETTPQTLTVGAEMHPFRNLGLEFDSSVVTAVNQTLTNGPAGM